MKKWIVVFTALLSLYVNTGYSQSSNCDTTIIGFRIAASEFGAYNEALIIRNCNDTVKAKYVRYINDSYGIYGANSLSDFYMSNTRNDGYVIMKDEWVLSDQEKNYIQMSMREIRIFPEYYPLGFIHQSNAPDYYTILSSEENFLLIDPYARWRKYYEMKDVLNVPPLKFSDVLRLFNINKER